MDGGSCPTVNIANTLTQKELLHELTNDCRYDKMVRPPGEINASDPIHVVCRANIYTIKSNMAKTLVIFQDFYYVFKYFIIEIIIG